MADDARREEADPVAEIELEEQGGDLDAAMREAVAAVEEVENRSAAQPAGASGDEPAAVPADEPAAVPADEPAALRREVEELRDRLVRTLADFDNFRKRTERERATERRYAVFELVRELVGVADNLERALAADGDVDDLKRGVELTLRHLLDLLRRAGVREVAAVGEPFDPTVHEAVSRHEGPAVAEPTVTRELQRGYLLHDRLVRPAMVEVAMPAPAGAADEAGPAAAGEEA
jgi:molecular chaperone GrpE